MPGTVPGKGDCWGDCWEQCWEAALFGKAEKRHCSQQPPHSPLFPGTVPGTLTGTFGRFGLSQSCSRRPHCRIIERGVPQAYVRARASSATLCSVHVLRVFLCIDQKPCPSFPCFLGNRQRKPPKKQGFFIPTEPLKSLEKKGKTLEETRKTSQGEKTRKFKKTRKGRTGKGIWESDTYQNGLGYIHLIRIQTRTPLSRYPYEYS